MAISTSLFPGTGIYGSDSYHGFFNPKPYTGYGSAYGGLYGIPMPGSSELATSALIPGLSSIGQPIHSGGGAMSAMKFGGNQPLPGDVKDYLSGRGQTLTPGGQPIRTGGLHLDSSGNVIPSGPAVPGLAPSTGYPVGATPNPLLMSDITGLLTPGLVPDIARQSAELAGGRGISGGSPAGYSTAVRMSEQDFLNRLGLANTLLSGEAGRNLPYQITPYQQSELELQKKWLENQQFQAALNRYYGGAYNTGRGGYGGGGGYSGPSMIGSTPYQSPGFGNYGNGPFGSYAPSSSFTSGPSGLGRTPTNLDEVYDWLGFGNFGSLPGDASSPTEPPDFDWEMWQ